MAYDKFTLDALKAFEDNNSIYLDSEAMEEVAWYYIDHMMYADALKASEHGIELHPDSDNLRIVLIISNIEIGNIHTAYEIADHWLADIASCDFEGFCDRIMMNLEVAIRMDGYGSKRYTEVHSMIGQRNLSNQEINELRFREYDILFKSNLFEPAMSLLDTIDDPLEQAHVEKEKGFCHAQMGQHLKATEHLNKAIDIDPYDADAWICLGANYSMFDDKTEEAIEAFEYALSIDENNSNAMELLASLYFRNGNYLRCIEMCAKASGENPGSIQLQLTKAEAYKAMKQYSEALEIASRIALDHPTEARAYACIKECYIELGMAKDCIEIMQAGVSADPTEPDMWLYLGDAYMANDERALAIDAYRRCLEFGGNNPALYLVIGQLYYEDHDAGKSLLYYKKCEVLSPETANLNLLMAVSYYTLSEYTQAMEQLERAQEIDPKAIDLFQEIFPGSKDTIAKFLNK